MDATSDAVAAVYERCLGTRVIALVVHGSAVTGDAFPGLSDIDFALALDSPLELEDAARIARELDGSDIRPYAYVQATYHQADVPRPSVVLGSFSLLRGALPKASSTPRPRFDLQASPGWNGSPVSSTRM